MLARAVTVKDVLAVLFFGPRAANVCFLGVVRAIALGTFHTARTSYCMKLMMKG